MEERKIGEDKWQQAAVRASAVLGALAVGLGAFGAHGLETYLTETGRTGTWETAVLYHLVHAAVLLLLSLMRPWRPEAWISLALGLVIFSGSLYILCLSQQTWLGAITPIGGLLLIAGWLFLLRTQKTN